MGPEGDKVSGGGAGELPDSIPEIPPEVITAVLSRLPPNEVALSARRTCRAAAQHFAEEHHRTAAIGQPLPPHAASGPLEEAETAFRGLTLNRKLYTLSAAAASGSVACLEVAWRLLRPCLFPEMLQTGFYLMQLRQYHNTDLDDAGTAAVKRCHISSLSLLLARCPGLVDRPRTLGAAAKHCPLPQLQEAWGLLSAADSSPRLDGDVLGAAAEAATPDAVAKMEWVLLQGGCSLTAATAAAAARSGDLARLRWLRERGCPCNTGCVLAAALQHADLSVAEWLVDEAGCPLPGPEDQEHERGSHAAAAASGSIAKLRWLRDRGSDFMLGRIDHMVAAAVEGGHLELLRFLQQEGGDEVRLVLRDFWYMERAIRSGSVETAAYLLDAGCPLHSNHHRYYVWELAGCTGSADMVRWLVVEAGEDLLGRFSNLIEAWPATTAAERHNAQLLEVLRMHQDTVLHDNGELMLIFAAGRSDVALLRYLHQELGFGLGPRVLAEAAGGGCEVVMEWLVDRGCAAGVEHRLLDGCYWAAGWCGNLAALECLRRLGVPWSEGLLLEAVEHGLPQPVVQWLWGQGARISGERLKVARQVVEGRPGWNVAVVEWLERQLAAA